VNIKCPVMVVTDTEIRGNNQGPEFGTVLVALVGADDFCFLAQWEKADELEWALEGFRRIAVCLNVCAGLTCDQLTMMFQERSK
jgi:hypothetical protein